MILVDANLLIYAVVDDMPEHERARTWFEDAIADHARVGLPWPSLLAFVRLTTNPRVFPRPLAMDAAWARVEEWLALDNVWQPEPTERHADVLGQLLRGTRATANLVGDAHLAAIAIEHGLELHSADRDFARFPGLRWTNPLA